MQELLNWANDGLNTTEEILMTNRIAIGLFFSISGYHKLFNRDRHQQLVSTLKACGIPFVGFCEWFVPLVEFFGGLAVLFGLLAPLAALGLAIILLVALATDGPKRIREYRPIDAADFLDDLLYLPETIYLVMTLFVIIAGPGAFSLHRLLVP